MASGKGNYWENAVLNYTLSGTAIPTLPATLYASLHTASVADTGGGAEVSSTGTGYARLEFARDGDMFPETADGTSENAELLQWAVATDDWGSLTSVGIWDASTGGNLLYWGDLAAPQTINTNNRFELPPGNVVISED